MTMENEDRGAKWGGGWERTVKQVIWGESITAKRPFGKPYTNYCRSFPKYIHEASQNIYMRGI